MKILLLSQFIPPTVGGTERHVWTLATALVSKGHDVTVLSFATDKTQLTESSVDGIRVVRTRVTASLLPALHSDSTRPYALPLPDPLVVKAIRLELATHEYDLVHAHNWIVNSALGPVADARLPLVMTLHEYAHVCATGRYMDHGRTVCDGPGLKKCLSCATSHYGPVRGPITAAMNGRYARRRSASITHTVAVSSAVAAAVDLEDGAWPTGASLKAEVIPNFIDDSLIVDEFKRTDAKAPLVYAGALNPDKGVSTLLDAYRALNDPPPLLLAGHVAPGVSWRLPPGAEIIGALEHDEVQELFRSARAVIVPSVWAEPFGIVVLEAMAAAKPVIAAAAGGIPGIIDHGSTGILVPPGDAPALARAIGALLADPAAEERLGAAARIRAQDFTVSAVVSKIESMYANVVSTFANSSHQVTSAATLPGADVVTARLDVLSRPRQS